MADEIKTGDVVRLKSGGPMMTVQEIVKGSDDLVCAWFLGDEDHSKAFARSALEKIGEADRLLEIRRQQLARKTKPIG